MIAAIASSAIIVGVALSCLGDRYPCHREIIETSAGWLLLGGFGLIGYGLECVLACR